MNTRDPRTQDFTRQQPMTSPPSTGPRKLTVEDLRLSTDVFCENCGHAAFHSVVLLKHFSRLASPSGEEMTVPIPTFACDHCSFINESLVPPGIYSGNKSANTPNVSEPAPPPSAATSTPEIQKSSLTIVTE